MNLLKTTYPFQVSPQSVDFRYKITLPALTDLLLTAARFNADENGFGMRSLQEDNNSWVLLRLAIEMNEFPEQYDEINIETWIHDIGRVSTTRNFRITNSKKEVIGYAVSNWAMIDMIARKAKDLATLTSIHHFKADEEVPIAKPAKLNAVAGEPFDRFKARYSHIDINQHVNTMRYVEWISNYFDLIHHTTHRLKRADFNFMNEILFGDEVTVTGSEMHTGEFGFEIHNNQTSSCRAHLVFEHTR